MLFIYQKIIIGVIVEQSSPCVQQCRVDVYRLFCVECLRTVEEVQMWRTLTNDQKTLINNSLHKRQIWKDIASRAAMESIKPGTV